MKQILIVFLILSTACNAQKISPCKYKHCDSVIDYDDAKVIIYRDKSNRRLVDTIFYSKQKCNIKIESVDRYIQVDIELPKRNKKIWERKPQTNP